MNLSRPHPANAFGWLHVDGDQYRLAFAEQQRLVKQALAEDPEFSGQPEAFDAWAENHVAAIAHQPAVAAQIERRRVELQRQIGQLEAELNSVVVGLTVSIEQRQAELKRLSSLPTLIDVCGAA